MARGRITSLRQRFMLRRHAFLESGEEYLNLDDRKREAEAVFLSWVRDNPDTKTPEDGVHKTAVEYCATDISELLSLAIDDPDLLLKIPRQSKVFIAEPQAAAAVLSQVVYWELSAHLTSVWQTFVTVYNSTRDVDESIHEVVQRCERRMSTNQYEVEYLDLIVTDTLEAILLGQL